MIHPSRPHKVLGLQYSHEPPCPPQKISILQKSGEKKVPITTFYAIHLGSPINNFSYLLYLFFLLKAIFKWLSNMFYKQYALQVVDDIVLCPELFRRYFSRIRTFFLCSHNGNIMKRNWMWILYCLIHKFIQLSKNVFYGWALYVFGICMFVLVLCFEI